MTLDPFPKIVFLGCCLSNSYFSLCVSIVGTGFFFGGGWLREEETQGYQQLQPGGLRHLVSVGSFAAPGFRNGFIPSEITGTVLNDDNKDSAITEFLSSHRLRRQSSLLLIMEISYSWITVAVFPLSLMNFQLQ